MELYISVDSYNALQSFIKIKAKEYDEKRGPGIHKFLATTFIDTNVLIRFENHQPVSFYYNGMRFGKVTKEKTEETDIKWVIKNYDFVKFLKLNPDFQVEYGNSNDGFVEVQTVKILFDFSVFD